ncbi:hypothetical protein BVY03_01250 [bacterium K02(2017)]|nr:hypothetical protein BVY03_01250 [bacterium K02(2017)]
MTFYLKKIVSLFIVPPISLIWVTIISLLIIKKFPRFGRGLGIISLFLLLVLSTPYVSSNLVCLLQNDQALTAFDVKADAIIVMGAGYYSHAPEYDGQSTLSHGALERVKYAAYLFDKVGLPILVAGGDPYKTGVVESEVMKTVLENEFLTPVSWTEKRSRDSFENAKYSYEILKKNNKTKVILITHAWHMPRAEAIFKKVGFEVIPAPTIIRKPAKFNFSNLIPQNNGFNSIYLFFHEVIGRIWYSIKYS